MSDRFDTDPDNILEPGDDETNDSEEETGPPRAKAPEVPVPEVPTPGAESDNGELPNVDGDVPRELLLLFGKLVFVIKFSLISLTLGSLFIVFEGKNMLGGQLLAFGLVLVAYGLYQYRTVTAQHEAGEFETEDNE